MEVQNAIEAGETGPGSVFVSYAREDQQAARQVIGLLESAGFKVWWDQLLEGGVNYLPETERALETADCVVVLWSRISVDSYWVRDEAQSGRERGRLVPLSIDGTMPPLGFRQFHVIDIAGWNGKVDTAQAHKVLAAVQLCCGQVAPSAQALGGTKRRSTFPLDRRMALLGGTALLAAGGIASWRSGLFGGTDLGENSIAVVPFRNLSARPDESYFSEGLSNELRNVLARNPRLKVSAPVTSQSLAEDDATAVERAGKVGVANILRGTVQRAGDTVRISTELVRVSDTVVRWAETFDRKLADIFAVQSEIAETVAAALVTEVAGEDEARASIASQQDIGGTQVVPAYEAYLQGRALYDLSSGETSDRAALAQFDAAIRLDPRYALAHTMRSRTLAVIANKTAKGVPAELFEQAIAAAMTATGLAPRLGLAHLALGFSVLNGRLDAKRAAPHYRKAVELAPGDAELLRTAAIFHAYNGDASVADPLMSEALALDPLNARAFRTAGYVALARRDYAAAAAQMDKALKLNPELASAHYVIGMARLGQGSAQAALEAFEREPTPLFGDTGRAIAFARLGRQSDAETALAKLVGEYGRNSLYQQAQVLAQWGRTGEAIEKLSAALVARDPGVLLARTDAMLDPLRREAAFSRLMQPLGA